MRERHSANLKNTRTMHKSISDETSTGSVVWAAVERIGKTANRKELERICDYLIKYVVRKALARLGGNEFNLLALGVLANSRNWFQTAGDLRAARQAAGEWQAYVLGRLVCTSQGSIAENCSQTRVLMRQLWSANGSPQTRGSSAPQNRNPAGSGREHT